MSDPTVSKGRPSTWSGFDIESRPRVISGSLAAGRFPHPVTFGRVRSLGPDGDTGNIGLEVRPPRSLAALLWSPPSASAGSAGRQLLFPHACAQGCALMPAVLSEHSRHSVVVRSQI